MYIKRFKKCISMSHPGFSLVEVMVAVSIFTIVVTIGVGSLLIVNRSNAQSRADREATDKISYLIEHLTRKLQTAIQITSDSDSTNSITFINQLGDQEEYFFDGSTGELKYIYEECGDSDQSCSSPLSRNEYSITPEGSRVVLERVQFFVEGNGLSDRIQPSVRVVLAGFAEEKREKSPFLIETIISLRILQFGTP